MNNGANEFGVSLLSFWIGIILVLIMPDNLDLIAVLGFVLAIAFGLLADKFKKLF